MGLFSKKKQVPAELPNLALSELGQQSSISPASPLQQQQSQDSFYKSVTAQPQVRAQSQVQPQTSAQSLRVQTTPAQPLSVHSSVPMLKALPQHKTVSTDDEQGYFKELIKSVTEETSNIEKLDSWYKSKFLPGDMVFQMREYWEKQQPELLLKNISGELKHKLIEKTNKLHELEKEWQEVYFHLLSKEEAIRKEEKELKGALSEFMDIAKSALKERDKK